MANNGFPTKPGYYWAKWQIATDDTHEGDDLTPAAEWEIVKVEDNGGEDDPKDCSSEALAVAVPGVRETQWRDQFIWGTFVAELNKPVKGEPSPPEYRPANCRERLKEEGKPYPRSGCDYCINGGIRGCQFRRAA